MVDSPSKAKVLITASLDVAINVYDTQTFILEDEHRLKTLDEVCAEAKLDTRERVKNRIRLLKYFFPV